MSQVIKKFNEFKEKEHKLDTVLEEINRNLKLIDHVRGSHENETLVRVYQFRDKLLGAADVVNCLFTDPKLALEDINRGLKFVDFITGSNEFYTHLRVVKFRNVLLCAADDVNRQLEDVKLRLKKINEEISVPVQ